MKVSLDDTLGEGDGDGEKVERMKVSLDNTFDEGDDDGEKVGRVKVLYRLSLPQLGWSFVLALQLQHVKS